MKIILKIIKNPLFWIFLLALVLRIYKLGEFPYGFHIDEVKVGWNALSILRTGLTDQNNKLSLYYNSFGDYRPSGIFYFTVPAIALLGRNEFATRIPVALVGALTIIPVYFLVELIEKNKNRKSSKIKTGHIASFLLAISPWHIEVSRATNEVVISTFFALFSIVFLIKLISTKKARFGIFTIISIATSYLFYHSIRFLGPLVFIATYYFCSSKNIDRKVRNWGISCIAFSIILTIFFGINQKGLARLSQTSIIKDVDLTYQIQRIQSENQNKNILTMVFDNKLVIYFKTFATEYGKYFSEDFLTGVAGRPYRFATPGVGLITYVELLLLIFGVIQVIKDKKNLLPAVLLILAPLPAAVTAEDSPNLSRAFFMIPFLIYFEALGLEKILSSSYKFKKQITIGVFALLLLNFSYFFYMYFNHSVSHRPYLKNYVGDSPTYRNVGTKELALRLDSLKTKYDKIIITNFPDSPYPWYAFFTNKDASDINQTYKVETNERICGNIIFSQDKCPSEYALVKYSKQNILIVDSWECSFRNSITDGYPLKIVDNIKRPDGSEVYTFLERDWAKPLFVNGIYY
jgi:4-amino-4-deoxy-L-arabinose transferase-like glycosyltransferase